MAREQGVVRTGSIVTDLIDGAVIKGEKKKRKEAGLDVTQTDSGSQEGTRPQVYKNDSQGREPDEHVFGSNR